MASAQFEKGKCKTVQHIMNLLEHCEKLARMNEDHINPHIDLSLTAANFGSGGTAKERMETILMMLEECVNFNPKQTGKNKNLDKVLMHFIDVPLPPWYPIEEAKTFFELVVKPALEETFPGQVVCWDFHGDEVHEYVDARTGKKVVSRGHFHIGIVPYVKEPKYEWVRDEKGKIIKEVQMYDGKPVLKHGKPKRVQKKKEVTDENGNTVYDYKLDAKHVTGRLSIQKLNNLIDGYCNTAFNLPYIESGPIDLDRVKQDKWRDKYDVEELKLRSLELQQEEVEEELKKTMTEKDWLEFDFRKAKEMQKTVERRSAAKIKKQKQQIEELNQKIEALEKQKDELQKQKDDFEKQTVSLEDQIEALKKQNENLLKENKSLAEENQKLSESIEKGKSVLQYQAESLKDLLSQKAAAEGDYAGILKQIAEEERKVHGLKEQSAEYEDTKTRLEQLKADLKDEGEILKDIKDKIKTAESRKKFIDDSIKTLKEAQRALLSFAPIESLRKPSEGLSEAEKRFLGWVESLPAHDSEVRRRLETFKAEVEKEDQLIADYTAKAEQLSSSKWLYDDFNLSL